MGSVITLIAGVFIGFWLGSRETFWGGKKKLLMFWAPIETADKIQRLANWGKTRRIHDLFINAFAIFEVVWKRHRDGGIVILRDSAGNDKTLSLDSSPF